MHKLNQRQERFCRNYARCGVVWLSAALSGYQGGKASLGTQGYRLLRRPAVQGRVAELAVPVLIGVIRMAALGRRKETPSVSATVDTDSNIEARRGAT